MKNSPTKSCLTKLLACMLAFVLAFAGLPLAAIAEEFAQSDAPELVSIEAPTADEPQAEAYATDEPQAEVLAAETDADANATTATSEGKANVALLGDDAPSKATVSITVEATDEDGVAEPWLNATLEVDEGTDAMTATLQALDAAGLTYETSTSYYGTSLDAITSADGVRYALDYSEGVYTYWQFLVNGAYMNVGASSYILSAGDRITWHYGADSAATNPVGPDYDTETEPVDVDVEWAQFEDKGNVTDAVTPTDVVEEWRSFVGYASELVIADGYIFVAVGNSPWAPESFAQYAMQLVKVDIETGEVVATTPLAGNVSYNCRPLIANGLIYIPLDGGAVQAVNVTTMKTYWVSAAAEDGGQASTTLSIHTVNAATGEYDDNWDPVFAPQDLLFIGTAVYDSAAYGSYSKGSLRALDPFTGANHNEWTYNNYSAGFYWTNTVELDGRIIAVDTAGVLHVLEAGAWGINELGTLAFDTPVKSDIALYDGDVLVATYGGTLYRVAVSDVGAPSVVSSVAAISNCKSGPVVVGDKAIIAGVEPARNRAGEGAKPAAAVAVIDLKTMKVDQLITTADGEKLPVDDYSGQGIAVPVLVSAQDEDTICYFALYRGTYDETGSYCTEGGEIYWFRLGENEAHLLYAPDGDAAQYCDSPLVADAEGNLYYLNDSGNIIKLAANEEPEPEPQSQPKPEPQPEQKTQDDKRTNGTTANNGPANNGPANNNQRGGQGVPATGEAENAAGLVALCAGIALVAGAGLRRKETRA